MSKKRNMEQGSENLPRRIRLPGFLIEQEVGLGDAIKRVTSVIGLRSCRACEKRKAALNRWMTFFR